MPSDVPDGLRSAEIRVLKLAQLWRVNPTAVTQRKLAIAIDEFSEAYVAAHGLWEEDYDHEHK